MKQIIVVLMLLLPLTGSAQEENTKSETTVYADGQKITVIKKEGKIKVKVYEQTSVGDTIENDQIFEGVYMNGQSTERRMGLSMPFTKKSKDKNYRFSPHAAGVYIGYSRLYDDFGMGSPKDVNLVASKSWEIGFTLFEGDINLSRNKQWGLTAGLGWGYTSFRVDGNSSFREIDGITANYPAPEGISYDQSRLRYFYFRIPVSLEWQKRINGHHGPLFFSAGLEAEIRHGVRSKVKFNDHSENAGKELNVRPVGINMLVQGGYGDIGVYARYSTLSLFEKNKGPELYPLSFGLCWFW